ELLDWAVLGHEHVRSAPPIGLREVNDARAFRRNAQGRNQQIDLLAVELRYAIFRSNAGHLDLVWRAECPGCDLLRHVRLDAGEFSRFILVTVWRLVAPYACLEHAC